MPDTSNLQTFNIGSHLTIQYKGVGAFVEIKNRHNGEFIWCDPWISDKYYFVPETRKREEITKYLAASDAKNKLRGILVSHSHGDHFADVPTILSELSDAPKPPHIYGDSNVQSLMCQYFAVDPTWKGNYGFYANFTSGKYKRRELSFLGNIADPNDRQRFGLVHNIQGKKTRFSVRGFSKSTRNNKFYIRVTRIPWTHSSLPSVILNTNKGLVNSPTDRTRYVYEQTETNCPSLYLYAFIFNVFEKTNNGYRHESRFALIPGPEPRKDKDMGKFYNAIDSEISESKWKSTFSDRSQAQPFDLFYYVPSAKDFIKGENGRFSKVSRKLDFKPEKAIVFHTTDGDK